MSRNLLETATGAQEQGLSRSAGVRKQKLRLGGEASQSLLLWLGRWWCEERKQTEPALNGWSSSLPSDAPHPIPQITCIAGRPGQPHLCNSWSVSADGPADPPRPHSASSPASAPPRRRRPPLPPSSSPAHAPAQLTSGAP